jgi:hypothetical protein
MDYEVFVLSRIREEYDNTHSTNQAVVNALARTGRLVTSAAVILCISFASITLTPNVDIKVLAFGLAAGILLDAVVIRSLLVPALVALFGRWNWWMPDRLGRILRTATVAPLPAAENPTQTKGTVLFRTRRAPSPRRPRPSRRIGRRSRLAAAASGRAVRDHGGLSARSPTVQIDQASCRSCTAAAVTSL